MCCSEPHYPQNAGIWRTDIVGHHHHYAGIVSLPSKAPEGGPRRVVENLRVGTEYCQGMEGDHWHANMPVRITACIDNNGPTRFALRAHDWFRWARERSMGIDRDGVMYGGHFEKGLGEGYDYIGQFDCRTPQLRDDVRELVLMAVSEGCEISDIGLRKVISRVADKGVRLKTLPSNAREVTRGYVPDLDEWRRGNPFVKPPLNDNDLLYASDMDDYTIPGHGASASGLWTPEGTSFEDYSDGDAAPEWSVNSLAEFREEVAKAKGRKVLMEAPRITAQQQVYRAKKARAKNAEPKKQADLFNLGI